MGLGDAATTLENCLPALDKLNIQQVMAGDLSSLTSAAPDLLKGLGFDGAAETFESMQATYEGGFGSDAEEPDNKDEASLKDESRNQKINQIE